MSSCLDNLLILGYNKKNFLSDDVMAEDTTEKQDWYARNREDLARRRHEKYHNDDEYRQKLLARKSKRARDRRREIAPFVEKSFFNKTYKLLRIGDAAERAGVSKSMIRDWEAQGHIPKPSFPSKHRYYTAKQAKLIQEYNEQREADPDKASRIIKRRWESSV